MPVDPVFRLEMLPAGHGDCLWLEYGDAQRRHRVLIDGGTESTYRTTLKARIDQLALDERHFDLLILTHIDADHIGGVLTFLSDSSLGATFGDVWFNGFRHLSDSSLEEFGPVQGERLTRCLVDRRLPWNVAFAGAAAVVPAAGSLPVIALPGGLELTLLSPDLNRLRALRPVWMGECQKAGLDPASTAPMPEALPLGIESMGPPDVEALALTPFAEDEAAANGSSIAVLAAFKGCRLLLTGDAHPTVLESAINRLVDQGQRLAVDAFKLPHHGSKANVSRELLERVECKRYLLSTNGAYFRHPDKEAVARVIKYGRVSERSPLSLFFNYTTAHNTIWNDPSLMSRYRFETVFPTERTEGLSLEF